MLIILIVDAVPEGLREVGDKINLMCTHAHPLRVAPLNVRRYLQSSLRSSVAITRALHEDSSAGPHRACSGRLFLPLCRMPQMPCHMPWSYDDTCFH